MLNFPSWTSEVEPYPASRSCDYGSISTSNSTRRGIAAGANRTSVRRTLQAAKSLFGLPLGYKYASTNGIAISVACSREPSLATMFSITYKPSNSPFHSKTFGLPRFASLVERDIAIASR
jgi:hypothetical protein